MKTEVTLILTGAIGDAILASALQKPLNDAGYRTGLVSPGFTLPLWNGLENVNTYAFGRNKSVPPLPKNAMVADLRQYLSGLPYSNPIPELFTDKKTKLNHLCEWLAYTTYLKTGLKLKTTRDDVRIVLNKEETLFGRDEIHRITKKQDTKKIVVISPYSSVKNKNLPISTLEEVINGIKSFAIPCQLTPYAEHQKIQGATPIGNESLRKSAAILLAAHAYIGVDSGPLHLLMGAIQGTPEENIVSGVNNNPKKAVVALGSSDTTVVTYKNNQIVSATEPCGVAPCGAHGYESIEAYSGFFKTKFYPTKDKSGCVFEDYELIETARCMEMIPAEEIIEKIKAVVKR